MRFKIVTATPAAAYEIWRAVLFGITVMTAATCVESIAERSSYAYMFAWVHAWTIAGVVVGSAIMFFFWQSTARKLRDCRNWVDSVDNVAFVMVDPYGCIETWTKGAETLFGHGALTMHGSSLDVLFADEDVAKKTPHDLLRLAAGNGSAEHAGWATRKNGTRFWANIILTPILDSFERLRGYSMLIRDETVRKIAEDQVRDNHELLEAVVNGTFDVISLKDKELRYRLINAAGSLFLGRGRNEVEGETDFDLFTRADAQRSHDHDRAVMETGAACIYEEEVEIRGSRRILLSHKTPWRDHRGNILGVISIATDITDRKMREQHERMLHVYEMLFESIPASGAGSRRESLTAELVDSAA